ncbi:alkene reductase [Novosphingobium sp. FKTRR1]|uniref:alkene reductase n=1 Tax=Novosphingobium sp. FKTRR1 TaxID=2879118 RepID=UPI001CF065A4|nr:alkene reductase [Novosphingobium sp. FKTRR1]
MSLLFQGIQLGALQLANRIVMAPMTRDRAGPGDVPTALMAQYYRQRASAGLIVSEGTQPSPAGKGYWRTPGLHSQAQIDGWAKVAEAVHAEGGLIVIQLMHVGRVAVLANRGFDADVIAPSAIACPDKVPGPDGVPADCAAPRALAADELPALAGEFAQAARNARAAGIDGVELHCASGYLINQFLDRGSNRREDEFGGDSAGRARFPAMVVKALAEAIGADRVGVRISPGNPYNAMDPSDPAETFGAFLAAIDPLRCAYLHVTDLALPDFDTLGFLRATWSGPIIANNGLNRATAEALLASGAADATSFGRPFIANPDLVARFRKDAPLTKPDYAHLYTGEEHGYTDYAALPG